MQSINTDVWWRGWQSEERACAKNKKIKKKSMKTKHTAGFCWSCIKSTLFLCGVKNPVCSGGSQTQRIPEGSSEHTTMAGVKLLQDPQTGGRADAAAASHNKIFKKISFIEDSLVYTLIYGKGTQK